MVLTLSASKFIINLLSKVRILNYSYFSDKDQKNVPTSAAIQIKLNWNLFPLPKTRKMTPLKISPIFFLLFMCLPVVINALVDNSTTTTTSSSFDQQLSSGYVFVYVKPSSLNTERNCTSPNNPCKSVEEAISYANSIRFSRVHVYLMDGEYKCGIVCYQPLQSLILESFDQSKRIQFECNGGSFFTYLNAMNGLKLSGLKLFDFTLNNGGNSLVAVPLIEIENSILLNSVIYEPSRQFGTISVSVVNSQLEFVEFYATVTANFANSTLKNIKHTQETPSLNPGTFFNNCTIEKYQFISSSLSDRDNMVELRFSLLRSRVKDSDFLICRTSEISQNTFTGSVTIRQSFLASSKFENNNVSDGEFQFYAYNINSLKIGFNEFHNLLANSPVLQIANTLQTMFLSNNFNNVKNGISVSQSNYIALFQTNFRNSSISIRIDSLMDVAQSSLLMNYCDFNYNGDLTIQHGVYIKANIIQINDCTFNGNKAVRGGAVYVEGLAISLRLLANNNSAQMGGAIYAKLLGTDALDLRASTNTHNTAQLGGAIFVENPKPLVLLDYLKCSYNRAVFSGGCIYISEPGPYIIVSSFLMEDNNEAGSYGDIIGEPLNNITFTVEVISATSVVSKFIQNQDVIYSQYPGQELTISIGNLQTYTGKGERVSVKKLQSQVDVVSLSEGTIYSKKLIPNQLNSVTYSLDIDKMQLRQVHGYITIQNIVQNITINIADCPKGKVLQNPLSTGFVCIDTDNSEQIIIPISVVLGILLMIFIILLLFLTFRGVRHVYMKLNLLKRKEIAEKNLEDVIIENSFNSLSQPLLVTSDKSFTSQSLIIPIEEISIEKKIGEGSNGVVYLGKWKGKQVAIKALKSDTTGDEVGEFEREAAILNSLSHPNIVKFYGISKTSNNKYMVVEYIGNGSLDRLIYNSRIGVSPLNLKGKLDILISIANGMKYLHTLNPPLIHRDLKPGNILISNDFVGKVSDFGLSTPTDSASTKNIGTVFYMASEMIESGSYTTKVDVYSFSIIMWEVFFEEHCYCNSRVFKIHRFGSNDATNSTNEYTILCRVLKGSRPKIPFSTNEEMNIWLSEFVLPTEKKLPLEILSEFTRKYLELMQVCWDKDPSVRPSFTEIMSELNKLKSILESKSN
ncbi:predicted protein [Naegleria gruberi]|uniref:Predicted protein n=1 Tax=Naegleria gruberi TaxID=5762 RepID=D2VMX2_NAEGR|nr:uncharacterized protein NAEGRDRAFT_50874 [Naegleria gruberi]EFC41897.1 predicted protein [Naegleria gruberi]|eukprot:XP_002674641.1 predicted protein [Naegleria gruberi strain NEG-M]